ncbi:DUF4430 domain-containing protein [Burkholderia ubonensis]|uniref:DUF4430 domain-containing protein n=1 Tax=Burkholderia ubonensis TaxID=101571 RepID=UPI0009B57FEB
MRARCHARGWRISDARVAGPEAEFCGQSGSESRVEANQGGNGYWWVYFVNGQMPDVSCAVYTLQPGDSVAWDYKHYSRGLKQAVHPPLV